MKFLKSLFAALFFMACVPLNAQVASFDEMEFEADSLKTSYKPAGKNFVNIKSKRGSSGVNKTAQADAILTAEVTEIVLVFSETESSDLAEREQANRERWENLLMTYPELFQFSTTYKNVCQCKVGADAEVFKQSQGFYVYINGDVPKVAEEPKPVAATPPPVAETKKVESTPPPAKTEKAPEKEVAVQDKTSVKPKETPPPVIQEQSEPAKAVVKETPKEAEPVAAEETEVVRETPKKKAVSTKPRRAKDAKACRPPCYGYGDEDLVAFFKEKITLTKKQKKKAKNWVANVRLQIHHDGTIKKAMVTGSEENFNVMVQDAVKGMNNWNSAVKNGVAVKSEVRFMLKYDKSTKSMRPSDFVINPRPSPKCQCVSDSEMFND